jgi:ribosomal protein S18 acetylase RimI-like enzyme
MFKHHIINHTYPFPLGKDMGTIEFVSTSTTHRRLGIAYGLLSHIMEQTRYHEYVLEVADINTAAQDLYKKLGFYEHEKGQEGTLQSLTVR